ncbi:MAG: FHA domain-containing protein [Planctomycetes bacterium]|nr:FHA domain-containing protein [Planctomycetota bacterium]
MSAKLEFLSGKRKGDVFELADREEFGIGNRKSAQIRVRDPWISYKHAKICVDSGRFFIEDLGSSNGTWIDGQRIEREPLKPGMLLYLGKTKLKFTQENPPTEGGGAWWDKVLDTGGEAQPVDDASLAKLARLTAEVTEERGKRRALERFFDLPEDSTLADAAKAGELEAKNRELETKLKEADSGSGASVETAVAEATERLRRDHMSQVVELEAKAKQAESRGVDFENRYKDKVESAKSELTRVKEGYDQELEQARASLEEARAGGAPEGDEALGKERERASQLEKDLAAARDQARQLEEDKSALSGQLEEAKSTPAPSSEGSVEDPEELKSKVWAAVEEATRWKEDARKATDQLELAQAEAAEARAKHAEVTQEIDEISMEQIEIEEELNLMISILKESLVQASGRSADEVNAGLKAALEAEAKAQAEGDAEGEAED